MKKNYMQPTIDVVRYATLNLMVNVSGGGIKGIQTPSTGSDFPTVSAGR